MSEIIKTEDLLDSGECGSSNSEDFQEYLENILDDIFESNGGEIKVGDRYSIYIGTKLHPSVKEFTPDFLDFISEQACDEYGDFAESWFSHISEKESEDMSNKINNFIESLFNEKGLEPNFYKVGKIREIKLIVSKVSGRDWGNIEFKECNSGEGK